MVFPVSSSIAPLDPARRLDRSGLSRQTPPNPPRNCQFIACATPMSSILVLRISGKLQATSGKESCAYDLFKESMN